MNRRTILRGGAATGGLLVAGCADIVRNLELRTPVPISVVNETGEPKNVEIAAFAVEDDRQTYEEAINVKPDQRADLGHLDSEEQRLRVSVIENDEVAARDADRITERTQSVRVSVTPDGLEIQVNEREDAENGE